MFHLEHHNTLFFLFLSFCFHFCQVKKNLLMLGVQDGGNFVSSAKSVVSSVFFYVVCCSSHFNHVSILFVSLCLCVRV